MQIRLTVTLGPRGSGQGAGGSVGAPGTAPSCDVLVTAPSGTPLSAVTGALVSTAASAAGAGAGGAQGGADSPASITPSPSTADSSAAVYVGTERLDPQRQTLGEPPLLDGAVVSLHGPVPAASTPALAAYGSAKARLHVVAGPDAGGIHLLQGGQVRLGRSAETDVPLDDPDVSRLHCAVTVSDGGGVTVADLDSTNGTALDGRPRRPAARPVPSRVHAARRGVGAAGGGPLAGGGARLSGRRRDRGVGGRPARFPVLPPTPYGPPCPSPCPRCPTGTAASSGRLVERGADGGRAGRAGPCGRAGPPRVGSSGPHGRCARLRGRPVHGRPPRPARHRGGDDSRRGLRPAPPPLRARGRAVRSRSARRAAAGTAPYVTARGAASRSAGCVRGG